MRYFVLVALLFAAACGLSNTERSNLPPGTTIIELRGGAIGGQTTIRDGNFIAWRSVDGMAHTVTSSNTPAFTEVEVPAGGTSTAVHFTAPGNYQYFCSIHGTAAENGTVHVLPPGS